MNVAQNIAIILQDSIEGNPFITRFKTDNVCTKGLNNCSYSY